MIHELLLALSGHPSPLFSEGVTPLTSQLSAAELALLKQLGQLGHLHRDIRVLATLIGESHDSVICRAIATSISNTQLSAFQQKILLVEQSILSKDSSIVGAYDIVPLSGIVKAFAGWSRRLAWLKKACEQMHGDEGVLRSGANMINWLRAESRTGFSDLELIILDLIGTGEKAWLRQLSTWIFYGRLSPTGVKDFLVQGDSGPEGYRLEPQLCPAFVTPTTARSILFIGRSLSTLKNLDSSFCLSRGKQSTLADNAKSISSLKHPIANTSLAQAIGKIRRSLAQNVLQNLLPSIEVVRFLNVLQEFFLISRGEFSMALVGAADLHLRKQYLRDQKSSNLSQLADSLIKDNDVTAILRKTWTTLVTFQNINDDGVDSTLDLAREILHLHLRKREKVQKADEIEILHTIFDDTLLGVPVTLSVQPSSTLSLFFTSEDSNIYSMIHAYLIGLRRIHIHLTELWKLSILRQCQSSLVSVDRSRIDGLDTRNVRNPSDRVWWVAVFSATFFITELSAYFQEVITKSWEALKYWICEEDSGERDPETIAAAHYAYLLALKESMLFNNITFVKELRKLVDNCNQTVTLAQRLGVIRQAFQALHVKIGDTKEYPPHLVNENHEIQQDLVLAAQCVSKSLKDLMVHLQEMDTTSSGLGFSTTETVERNPDLMTSFVPWKGSGIRSLLLKLDLQAINND